MLYGPRVDGCTRCCCLLILVLISAPVLRAQSSDMQCGASGALCVYTYGYDPSRDNVNPNESILKASTLTSLAATNSPDLKGIVYAQPLFMSGITIGGQSKNAVFVATEENWVYALDSGTLSVLWSTNLNVGSETAVPDSALPGACPNIAPEVGITGTPVIDPDGTTMFVVSKHYNGSTTVQRLNAIDLTSGAKLVSLDIGQAITNAGGTFSALNQNQRAGLALVSQSPTLEPWIYVAWASHCDAPPYNGIVASFLYSTSLNQLTLDTVFNTESSSGSRGGIWMSGAAPAVTSTPESTIVTDVYLSSGNGQFTPGQNWGESVLRLHHGGSSIAVTGSYTPNAWLTLNQGTQSTGLNLNLPAPYTSGSQIKSPGGMDLASGGVALARPAGSGFLPSNDQYPFEVLAGGKERVFYALNPSTMNNSGADTVDPCSTGTGGQTVQCFGAIQLLGKSTLTPGDCCSGAIDYGKRGSTAFWSGNSTFQENVLYVAGSQDNEVRAGRWP